VALVWCVLVALAVWRLERTTKLPSDTVIGILFTSSLAIGVVLMSFTRGFQPDLVNFMFGSILAIRPQDIMLIAAVAGVLAVWLGLNWRSLAYLSLSEDSAAAAGIPVGRRIAGLYVALALATVLGVKIFGIILVSALLILPPAAARMLSKSFRDYVLISLLFSEIAVVAGLILSYAYDLPSGAVIVLASTALFFLSAILGKR
jgi:ABC-type Mn2+/Zn2+ transport system permease subunit